MNPLIAEKINLQVDNDRLYKSVEPLLNQFPPVERSNAVAGWALQSVKGSYLEGWSTEFCPYNGPQNSSPHWNPQNDWENGLPPIQDYKIETEITSHEIQSLFATLNSLGLNPRKGRIMRLKAGTSSVWHIDGSSLYYQVRLHIPLVTNEGCFFENDHGKIQMQKDGNGYLVHVNQKHRVINEGSEDRLHFVANIWDTKHLSVHHKYDPKMNFGESYHPEVGTYAGNGSSKVIRF